MLWWMDGLIALFHGDLIDVHVFCVVNTRILCH